ncbi:hypothetical protein AB3S75_022968 [Citrus x aurantiifolia]
MRDSGYAFQRPGCLLDQPHLDQELSSYAFFSKYSCVHRNKSEHAGYFPGVNPPTFKSDMKVRGTLATDLMAFWASSESQFSAVYVRYPPTSRTWIPHFRSRGWLRGLRA